MTLLPSYSTEYRLSNGIKISFGLLNSSFDSNSLIINILFKRGKYLQICVTKDLSFRKILAFVRHLYN